MNQKIIEYLQQYKEQYSKDDLVKQLSKFGYSKRDINESAAFVYESNYNTSVRHKVIEFIGGIVFGPAYIIVAGYVVSKLFHFLFSAMDKMDEVSEFSVIFLEIVVALLPFLGIGIFIWLIWWLVKRKHKKYIAFGMLFGVFSGIIVIILGFATTLLAMILGG